MSEPRAILIVEDEPLIAMMLEDFLESLGHRVVGSHDNVDEALRAVEAGGFDVAIIDVQLKDGKNVWPVADRLLAIGTPFVLATGGHVEPPPVEHENAPVLSKPYTIDAIEPAIEEALAAERGVAEPGAAEPGAGTANRLPPRASAG